MSDKQPESLRIAEWFEGGYGGCEYEAAAELRRLHELNAELVEALRDIEGNYPNLWAGKRAREALAKAEGK